MTIVFKVSENIKKKMIKHYENMKDDRVIPYVIFQARSYDCVTTLYESDKVVFQGVGADIEASYWIEQERVLNNRIIEAESIDIKKKKEQKKGFMRCSTIGSDEVGTGDFFGPIVVTATYVSAKDIKFLTDLGVKDSKRLTDKKILNIAPEIIKKIPYVTYIYNNKSYNNFYSKLNNMNKIKAILHNKVLCGILQKDSYSYDKIVVDQFVDQKKYYEYLNEVPTKVNNITFMPKAEDQCISVAAASLISRYIFLAEIKKISKKYKIDIPLGAGNNVDDVAVTLVNKKGIDVLKEIAKMNFKNVEKIKEKMDH